MKLETLKVLSDDEIKQIHEASIDILEHAGVKIFNDKMLTFLREKGLEVDREKKVAYFTRTVIEDAISSIPETFEVFNREGEFAFVMGDGVSKIAAGHNAVFWVDSDTGKTRYSKVADVEFFAHLCDKLDTIDVIGVPVMPQDVENPMASLVYGVKACIEYCSKPIFFSTDNEKVNNTLIALIKAGFKGDLKNQVYGITQLSPTSPLYWEGNVINAMMDTIDTGVPIAILPEPNAGISAPYTLAGLLTVDNAECLSGLAMIQLLEPGYKVMYANSWTTTDMRSAAALVGSVETSVCRIAGAQLARFYKTPSHTTAPNSDNHAHDEQNSWEKTFSTFVSVGAGNDLIVNCGMFATGMTCSNEQLIMDAEISASSQRIARGMLVNEDTIACDMIKEIGPGTALENYLISDHTIRWLNSDEHLKPMVSVRGPFASWKDAGAKDTFGLAGDMVRKYRSEMKGPSIDSERKAKLDEIAGNF